MKKFVGMSLFNGIGCCRLALERAGIIIGPGDFYTSEIDPDALGITRYQSPDDIELGDVCKIDGYPFRGIVNFLAAGSPCQSFSNAGNREGFDGESRLAWEFVRLKKEIQPELWVFENVRMKNEWEDIISNALGVQPIHINSEVASGQSRPRSYWTNIPYTEIKNKNILLGDVILGAVNGASKHGRPIPEYLKTPGGTNYSSDIKGWEFSYKFPNKSYCLTKNGGYYINTQGKIKSFTPENCEVLQNLLIGYTGVTNLSSSKRIGLIGNAWTVDVLAEAFFKNLPWAFKSLEPASEKFLKCK
jgi:DNA (cytosine-5)-methyltransferase 3A